jgi:hypothetical protein
LPQTRLTGRKRRPVYPGRLDDQHNYLILNNFCYIDDAARVATPQRRWHVIMKGARQCQPCPNFIVFPSVFRIVSFSKKTFGVINDESLERCRG